MKEYMMLLPEMDNEGNPLDTELRKFLETVVVPIFGWRYTIGPLNDGFWRHPETGITYHDRNRALYIASERPTEVLRGAATIAATMFRQEAIYLRLPDGSVELLGPALDFDGGS